jgi:hypothetical protein
MKNLIKIIVNLILLNYFIIKKKKKIKIGLIEK